MFRISLVCAVVLLITIAASINGDPYHNFNIYRSGIYRGQLPKMRPFPWRLPFPTLPWTTTLPSRQQPGQPQMTPQQSAQPPTALQQPVQPATAQQPSSQPGSGVPGQPGQPGPAINPVQPEAPRENFSTVEPNFMFNMTEFDNSTFPLVRSFFPDCVVNGCAAGKSCDAASKSCRDTITDV